MQNLNKDIIQKERKKLEAISVNSYQNDNTRDENLEQESCYYLEIIDRLNFPFFRLP